MKKTIICFAVLLFCRPMFAYKFTGLPWEASQPVMETAGRNYLPWNAGELEQKFGINVHIFKYPAGSKIDTYRMASIYYNTLTRTPQDKILLIWLKAGQDDGVIIASDAVKKMVPEEDLRSLQDDVLRPFARAWYMGEQRVYSKILGTIIYILERSNDEKGGIAAEPGKFIKIDDPLYRISLSQPFYDIIKLFYFEPVTFCMYFPFVMYMLLVRLLGAGSNRITFIFFNVLWLFVTVFIFVLILNRVRIIFQEYLGIISFFIGLNAPLYFMISMLYWNNIETAAYRYLHNMTGGFGSDATFGASK